MIYKQMEGGTVTICTQSQPILLKETNIVNKERGSKNINYSNLSLHQSIIPITVYRLSNGLCHQHGQIMSIVDADANTVQLRIN